MQNAPRIFSKLDQVADPEVILASLRDLALVILVTYAAFVLLRMATRPLYRTMGRSAAARGVLGRVLIVGASALIDALVVVLAWAVGYGVTLLFFGEFGEISIRQTLYLNAFLVVEMAKLLLRIVLSPATSDLRLIRISDWAARYAVRWITVMMAILGYGQLLIIPIVNQNISFFAGRALSASLSVLVLLIAAVLVVVNRRRVSDWLLSGEGRVHRLRLLRGIARAWHWAALIYLAVLLVIVLTRPDGMLFPVLGASGQILAAVLAGMMITGAITRAIARGIELPGSVTARLPLLERRLNAFVPSILTLLRLLVFLGVAAFTLHTLGALDLRGALESRIGVQMTATAISVASILLVAGLVWLALTSWIDYRLNPDHGRPPTPREETLLTLLRNAATIAILLITLMFALSEIGIDIAPLLASAGVLGLAIGFGAQKLVQDIITGIFIQFENAISIGDVITVGGTTGTVEKLTIRSVSLRDLDGTFHIIPFSSVDMVSNYMRGFAYCVSDIGIAYREDVEEARAAMLEAFEELRRDPEMRREILGEAEWFGLTAFGDSAINLRVRIKTRPGMQWAVGRAYNAVLKRVFDARGIEIPFPHTTVYFGQDKDGTAPALHAVIGREPSAAAPSSGGQHAAGRGETAGVSPAPPDSDDAPSQPG